MQAIDRSVPSEVQRWLSEILPFWKQLETLVRTSKVNTLGVADLDYEQLKALYESTSDYRPMIDHYNTEHCCTVCFYAVFMKFQFRFKQK